MNVDVPAIKKRIALRRPVWCEHPEVGNHKTVGEHIADHVKHWLGTWSAFWVIVVFFAYWLKFVHDPGWVRFGTILWIIVTIQGIVLQISSNRSDRVESELALFTHGNTQTLMDISTEILDINKKQSLILTELKAMQRSMDTLSQEVRSEEEKK